MKQSPTKPSTTGFFCSKYLILLATGLVMISCLPQNVEPNDNQLECMAEGCVKNNTNDTVKYTWNNSNYSYVLLPGQTTCDSARSIFIKESSSRTYTTNFESSKGSIVVEVNKCKVISYLQDTTITNDTTSF